MRLSTWAAALLCGVCAPSIAWAQSAEEASRTAARLIGDEGLAAFAAGDYVGALAKFDRAELLVPVPTLGLRAARCLEKLGRWVEASERYERTAALKIDAALPAAFREAQAAAQTQAIAERAALLPKIPTLVVVVEGEAPDTALVDGALVPVPALAAPRALDQGEHVVVVKRGEQAVEGRIILAEGAVERLVLRWPAAVASPAPPAPPLVPRSDPRPPRDTPAPAGNMWTTAGWIGVGAGAVGLSVGAVTLAMALDRKSSLDELCHEATCRESEAPGARDDVDAYNALATTSTVAFVAGGVLALTGAALVLLAPEPAPRQARWMPLLVAVPGANGGGVAFAGARGCFH